MGKLDKKVALITGGSSGIGLATAEAFVREGARVFITGRSRSALDAAVARLGNQATAIQGDVSRLADLDKLFDIVKAKEGHIDVLFANAGLGHVEPLGQISETSYELTFGVNVKGTIFTVQKAMPLMKNGGSIILTGSTAGTTGNQAFSVYSATKAAIRNLARSWALDLKGTGIRVNVLSPGATATPALEAVAQVAGGGQMYDALIAQTPAGRIADVKEVAAVALFLASDDSSIMTGSEVFADGGLGQV